MSETWHDERLELAMQRLADKPGVVNLVRCWLLAGVVMVGFRTCGVRRHPIVAPIDVPGRGTWWACRCGRRLGGRVY